MGRIGNWLRKTNDRENDDIAWICPEEFWSEIPIDLFFSFFPKFSLYILRCDLVFTIALLLIRMWFSQIIGARENK